jgi:hypothetical protein
MVSFVVIPKTTKGGITVVTGGVNKVIREMKDSSTQAVSARGEIRWGSASNR